MFAVLCAFLFFCLCLWSLCDYFLTQHGCFPEETAFFLGGGGRKVAKTQRNQTNQNQQTRKQVGKGCVYTPAIFYWNFTCQPFLGGHHLPVLDYDLDALAYDSGRSS